ncbi:MAG: hypothetical protein JXA43_00215 [Candidatus Diapherotrites archaeon]|nr:hypothetical protein [Candidatus Diapherotrites archaeon]
MNLKMGLNKNIDLNTNKQANTRMANNLKLIPVGIPLEDYATAKKRNGQYVP